MAVSVAALAVLRRQLRSLFQGRLAKTDNMDDPVFINQYVGRDVLVLETVEPDQPGLVELNGTNWQARTEEGRAIAAGRRARVVRLEGLTLIIAERMPDQQ